jgi:YHS domain-containing protein
MTSIRALAFVLALATASAFGADGTAPAAPAAKTYPLDTCIVSGEKLGEMGDPVVVVKDGQEYKFCCHDCVKQFEADPKKFADKLAAADAAKAKDEAAAPAAKPEEAAPKAK